MAQLLTEPVGSQSPREAAVQGLYRSLLEAWNHRDAHAFAALFDEDGYTIGFDGSQMDGRAPIEATLRSIFNDHQTGAYVGIVRGLRFLSPQVAVLRAVAGVVPYGETGINPALNAVQTLVAMGRDDRWRIAVYQNTPAQLHGRPDLAEALTAELRQEWNRSLRKGKP